MVSWRKWQILAESDVIYKIYSNILWPRFLVVFVLMISSSGLCFLLHCSSIQRMETMDTRDEEGMEMDGSAVTVRLGNITLNDTAVVMNITFFPYYQHSMYVAASYILAYLFIFLLCMVGNILVCLIVLENRRMRTVTNLFILNLAISDLLVGIFCIPTTLVDNLITGNILSSPYLCLMSRP